MYYEPYIYIRYFRTLKSINYVFAFVKGFFILISYAVDKMKPLENKIIPYLTIVSIKLSKIEDKEDGNSVELKEDTWWQRWDFNRDLNMAVGRI